MLVKAIVDLAHEFGLTAVAEGVETPDVIERLRGLGCDVAQGYHWSRPVPPEELPEVVDRLASESDSAALTAPLTGRTAPPPGRRNGRHRLASVGCAA